MNQADQTDLVEEIEVMIHTLIDNLPVSPTRFQELKNITDQDPVLRKLRHIVKTGWPNIRNRTPPEIRQYWNLRREISDIDGILFLGDRIIIPQSEQQNMLTLVHEGHLGMEKSKQRAREILFWPNMTQQIEDMVAACSTCLRFKQTQQKEPLKPPAIPDRAWQKVGCDIMTFKQNDYLIVVDYYSKYPEMALLSDKTASEIVIQLKSIFSRHGIPEEVFSDNMPFNSNAFHNFAMQWVRNNACPLVRAK